MRLKRIVRKVLAILSTPGILFFVLPMTIFVDWLLNEEGKEFYIWKDILKGWWEWIKS